MTNKKIYIEYLNKDKNFNKDKIYFNTYNDAVNWGKENFENFNFDFIRFE
jgi:hypothetical protein